MIGNSVDYLLSLKTKPGSQDAVRRELQRRIKVCLETNNIEPGDHNRLTIAQAGTDQLAEVTAYYLEEVPKPAHFSNN